MWYKIVIEEVLDRSRFKEGENKGIIKSYDFEKKGVIVYFCVWEKNKIKRYELDEKRRGIFVFE